MDDGIGVLRAGVTDAVRADFPRLELWVTWVAVPSARRSPRALKDRLAEVDDRVRGLPVGGLRRDPVAASYRGFARQIGLDPDVERNPLEQLAIERLTAGRLVSDGPLRDAMTVAMLETGVPLWAIDAEAVYGWLRVDVDDAGRLAMCDERGPVVPLLMDPGAQVRVPAKRKATMTAIVYALKVGDVPASTLEETFWHVRATIGEATQAGSR